MKILKIAFKNIHSLEGYHEIDFTQKPFSQSGLFAITGPTGSGKSTILDAISLALYNETPRLGRVTKNEMKKSGGVLTRGKSEAMASVTYLCNQGIYQSEWTVRVARTGNLQEYRMSLYDSEGKILNDKKTEVPLLNQAYIGLNYDQFIKSVVLAQGNFAKFLKVDKNERSALLEQITGTEIYRKIGIKAYEHFKEIKIKIESWENLLQHAKEKILPEEEFLNLKKEASKLMQRKEESVRAKEKIQAQIAVKEQIKVIEQQIYNFQSQVNQATLEISEFEKTQGKALKAHKKTEKIAPELFEWANEKESYQQRIKIIQTYEAKIAQSLKNRETLITHASELTKNEITTTHFEERIKAFYEEVKKLQEQRKELQQSYKWEKMQLLAQLSEIKKLAPLDIETPLLGEQLETLRKEIEKEREEIAPAMMQYDIRHLPETLERLRNQLNHYYKIEKIDSQIKNLKQLLNEKIEENKKTQEVLIMLPKELEVNKEAHALKEEKYKLMQEKCAFKKLQQSLEEHRRQLKPGKPCPLCGATEHPFFVEEFPQGDTLQKQMENLREIIEKSRNQISNLSQKLKLFKEKEQQEQRFLQQQQEQINEKIKSLKADPFYSHEDINWERKIEESQKTIEKLQQWQILTENYERIEKSLPIHQKLKEIEQEGKSINHKIADRIGTKDIQKEVDTLLKQWNQQWAQYENQLEELERNQSELALQQSKVDNLQQSLATKVAILGFPDIETAQQSRLEYEKAQQLQQTEQNLHTELKAIEAKEKLVKQQLIELQGKESELPYEELLTQLNQEIATIEQTETAIEEVSFKIKENQTLMRECMILSENIEKEIKNNTHWRMLDKMIGDAKGEKFNRFAQELTLKHLLHLANKRLITLTSRYLIDQPEEMEGEDLVAIDKDMGNQRRSVKTLSGGETFILSLALALALSDLASKNIKINSLFIDEGFGTLDPETLDQTIDTLEKLQQESHKMIGIISHVETLKERITTQIQLKQNGFGLSTLTIKG